MKLFIAICVGAVLLAGCEKASFTALTVAPPTKEANLNESRHSIRISRNVAMAIECQYNGRPCGNLRVTSDDSTVAEVYPVHLDELRTYYADGKMEEVRASVFLVLGKSVGKTRIHVKTSDTTERFVVNVLDD